MTWFGKLLDIVRALLDALDGNPASVAAAENSAATQRELDRERKITAALRLRVAEKEARIHELEKAMADRDPGALLDSVFGAPPPGPKT